MRLGIIILHPLPPGAAVTGKNPGCRTIPIARLLAITFAAFWIFDGAYEKYEGRVVNSQTTLQTVLLAFAAIQIEFRNKEYGNVVSTSILEHFPLNLTHNRHG